MNYSLFDGQYQSWLWPIFAHKPAATGPFVTQVFVLFGRVSPKFSHPAKPPIYAFAFGRAKK